MKNAKIRARVRAPTPPHVYSGNAAAMIEKGLQLKWNSYVVQLI